MTDSIKDRLKASHSVASLRAEQSVREVLVKAGWTTFHGPFYRDPDSGKLREIDIVARQIWTRKLKSGEQVLRFHLHFEVKSAKGYHILFSEVIGSGSLHYQYRIWPGFLGHDKYRWLVTALAKEGMPAKEIHGVITYFQHRAFPREIALVRAAMFDPPPLTPVATAFRESNIGSDKDLEASVLWKATLALTAAFRSLRRDLVRYHAEGIAGSVGAAMSFGQPISDWLPNAIDRHVRMIDYFHPAVIIDSPLWIVDQSSIREVRWVRFVQLEAGGSPIAWCDVVRSEALSDYVGVVTAHYARHRSRLRAELEPWIEV